MSTGRMGPITANNMVRKMVVLKVDLYGVVYFNNLLINARSNDFPDADVEATMQS